jgi:hypothetical protein
MTRLVIALMTLIAAATGASSAPEPACNSAAHLVRADFPLPKVAEAIKRKHLDVAVIGTASSTLMEPAGAQRGYPSQLEAALSAKLPGVKVRVQVFARPRETAAQMEKGFDAILGESKPALTVWQTGTVEAMRRIDIDDFRVALDEGIERLQQASSDVVLMNQQYSPRTELMIDAPQYAEAMRFVALQHEVSLFDRFSVMRHWGELGIFDLNEATKKIDTAARVHNCIGGLLASLIVEGANLPADPPPGNH